MKVGLLLRIGQVAKFGDSGFLLLAALSAILACGCSTSVVPRQIDCGPEFLPAIKQLVETDWQSEHQLMPKRGEAFLPPARPSDEFVRLVMTNCFFEAVDLNRDGRDEVIVTVNYGVAPSGNTSFYVLQHQRTGWNLIGGPLLGNSHVVGNARTGFRPIIADWRNNIESFTATTYSYRNGRYQKAKEEVILVRGDRE